MTRLIRFGRFVVPGPACQYVWRGEGHVSRAAFTLARSGVVVDYGVSEEKARCSTQPSVIVMPAMYANAESGHAAHVRGVQHALPQEGDDCPAMGWVILELSTQPLVVLSSTGANVSKCECCECEGNP